MNNLTAYSDSTIVNQYSKVKSLQKVEKIILYTLKNKLGNMKMLDIGVGTGRTTLHFASLVKEYIGIDYSEPMIDSCKRTFSKQDTNISFKVCDATDMNIFPDNYFDFILFSFNGIDYISHEAREKAFLEIQRIGKSNAYFCFSTHNILSIYDLFSIQKQFSMHPRKLFINLKRWYKINSMYKNPEELIKDQPYILFNDGSLDFSLVTHYINPKFQKTEIQDKFNNIEVFSLDGERILDDYNLNKSQDPWLYFLCRINK